MMKSTPQQNENLYRGIIPRIVIGLFLAVAIAGVVWSGPGVLTSEKAKQIKSIDGVRASTANVQESTQIDLGVHTKQQGFITSESPGISDNNDMNDEFREEEEDAIMSNTPYSHNLTDPQLRNTLFRLTNCKTEECIRSIHKEINGRTRFNFPHFFLVGWQKCATTSIERHLRQHPQYLAAVAKESHWYTTCQVSVDNQFCKANDLRDYFVRFLRIKDAPVGGLEQATADNSVDYAWMGVDMAKQLYAHYPWLKIVMIMRDPISRMISYMRMHTERQNYSKGCHPSKSAFECLEDKLNSSSALYAAALEGWLETFPLEQIHVMQFEMLQKNESQVLYEMKEFLGMDPRLPIVKELVNVNPRKLGGGYPMTRSEYEILVNMVRPGANRVARLLGKYSLANETEWLGRWEAVWSRTVEESCDNSGACTINSN